MKASKSGKHVSTVQAISELQGSVVRGNTNLVQVYGMGMSQSGL